MGATLTPQPNYTAWRFWVDMVVLAFVILNTAYTWWSNREKVNSKRFKTLEGDVAQKVTSQDVKDLIAGHVPGCPNAARTSEVEKTLLQVKGEIRNMPTRPEIQGLNNNITALTSELGQVKGRLDGINRVADLMNQHLINQGGNK